MAAIDAGLGSLQMNVVGASAQVAPMILWLLVLIGVVLGSTMVLLVLRRRLMEGEEESGGAGFDLRTLRQLRARGELTEQEYETARDLLIAGVHRGGAAQEASGEPNPTEGGRQARKGFDLTGEPLPGFDPGNGDQPGEPGP